MTPNSVYRTLVAKRHIVPGMLALACALMASPPAGAQVITTWTGGAGTTSWNNASNWSNGSPSNTAGSTTTINLPNAAVTTPANVSIRSLTVSGSLGAGQTPPTLTISNNFTVVYTAMTVGSLSSGSNFQGIVNHTSGTVSITLGAGASRLNIANFAGGSTSNNRGEYNLNGSQSAPAALVVDSTVFIGGRPGETGLLSLDGYGSLSAGSLNLGNFNGAAELRVRGGNLAMNIGGGLSMGQSGGGSSTLAATLTNSGSTGFSTINTTGAVQFGNGSLNPTTFTLALDGWVSSGLGQVVTILSSGSTFTGAGVFGNLANGATLTRASGTATGSPSYTFTASYGLDNADSRTKFNLTVSSADLTWNNGSSDGMWSTGTANAGFTGTRWLPRANATFGATGAGAVTVSGTQSVRNLTVSSAGYSFSGGSLSPVSSGTWSIANDTTIASTLTGTGGLVKAGVGSLVLTGTSDYSGNTTISAGTLRISGAGQLGGGSYAGAISNSGTLAFASAANQTLSGAITGAGALAKSAAGSLSITNTASFTGGLTVSAGTLAISGGVAGAGLTISGSDAATATLNVASNLSSTNNTGFIVGSNSQSLNGWRGIVNQTSGTVSISGGASAQLWVGAIAASNGGSTSNSSGEYYLSGLQSAPSRLAVEREIYVGSRSGETGLLSLSGYGTVSGTSLTMGQFNGAAELRVRGGNLAVNIGGGLIMSPFGGGNSTIAATLTDSGSTGFSTITTAGAVQFGNTAGTLNPTTFTLALDGWVSSGVGQVVTVLSSGSTFTGAGRFNNVTNGATLTGTSGTAAGSPNYTFTAGYGLDNADSRTKFNLTVASANLTWNNGSADGVWSTGTANAGFTGSRWVPEANVTFGATGAGAVTVSGTQSVRNLTVSSAGYSFSGGGLSLVTTGTWSIANATTIASALSGTGGFTKIGAGTLTLTGSSTYSGPTQINAGRMLVNGLLGSTAVTVNSGGLLGGSGSILGGVTIAGGSLSPGNSPGELSLASLALSGSSTTLMEIDGLIAGTQYDRISLTDSLTYGGTLQLNLSQTFENGTTFGLFSGFSSFSGNLASIVSTGSAYAGATFTRIGNVWTSGTVGSQTLELNQATGTLVIVPEPAGLILVAVAVATGALARRCRHARHH